MLTRITPLERAVRLRGRGAQRHLAADLGLHESTLSRIVRGHVVPPVETQERIARALDVPRDELFPTLEAA